jgi:hypothetical protein
MSTWPWFRSGAALAAAFLLAVLFVKPIGVSTQFVILNGILARVVSPSLVKVDQSAKTGYASPNPYLNKSGGKYAANIAKPLNYSFVFVVAMLVGGVVSRFTRKDRKVPRIPQIHERRFGKSAWRRYALAFLGGIFVLWGARFAGGCTSGHMMSGMMQTAVSGYLFSVAAFVIAVPVAMLLYGEKGGKQ